MDEKTFVLDFIKKQKLATISTVNENAKPEAAVIGFGQTNNLELIFGTNNSSRKYKNVVKNSSVAFVIGWDEGATVQFEGIASELNDDDLPLIRDSYWSKSPDAEKYYEDEGQRYFRVRPTWIRYTDLKKEPWNIIVLEF
ncbi:MAG TPA: pyridoxamine 5'-phosphate oxidase family protein [Patescibacteria group bacterium]|nr:pyridoxamine 5'-phosphate oxidase family protein [Patescibacteria group bacterium]